MKKRKRQLHQSTCMRSDFSKVGSASATPDGQGEYRHSRHPLDFAATPAHTLPVKLRTLVSLFLGAGACIGIFSGALPLFALPPQAPESRLELSPSEIALYKGAQPVVDWPPQQIHHCPLLHKLRSVENQDQLATILERVGQTVTTQFHDFPSVACDEEISETHPGPGSVDSDFMYGVPMADADEDTTRQKLHYIIVPWPGGDIPAFDEYRTDLNGNPLNASSLRGFAMTSSKYASTCLYFSPADQHDSRFRYFGTQTIRERECFVVGFAQDPEKARRIDRFHTMGATFSLLSQGLAWIDPESFQILKINSWLLAPRKDIGIDSQSTTVDFYPFQPSGTERALWLPREVTVLLDFRGTKVRNTHRYSHYMLFRVEVKPGT